MIILLIHALCLMVAQVSPSPPGNAISPPTIETGYHQMYNLEFDGAHQTFQAWEQLHPADPLAPSSDAAAYLFAEFDRLGVLQSELFVNDTNLKKSGKLTSDPAIKQKFE